ncbi:MAG: GNAT family N-acetyltransferase [Anaerolineae bacterium]|nr:GNAT family N-acetyltransferase [Anaerolineae bacterium]
MIEIRPATLDELAVAEQLRATVFREAHLTATKHIAIQKQIQVRLEIREIVGEPPGHTWIAWEGDQAVGATCIDTMEYSNPVPGLAGLWALRRLGVLGALQYLALAVSGYRATRPEEVYFHGMVVLPAYRSQGVAMQLFLASEAAARKMGKTWGTAFIAEENVASQKFAEKCGFRRVDRPRPWWRRLLFGRARFVYYEKSLKSFQE